jgi:hypothetical protein
MHVDMLARQSSELALFFRHLARASSRPVVPSCLHGHLTDVGLVIVIDDLPARSEL